MMIELSDLRVLNYHYIYPKETRESTPYSESPVRALRELNRDPRRIYQLPKVYVKRSRCSDLYCYVIHHVTVTNERSLSMAKESVKFGESFGMNLADKQPF
jgi:hypothetical protein